MLKVIAGIVICLVAQMVFGWVSANFTCHVHMSHISLCRYINDNIIIELSYHVHRVCKFSSFNPEIHLIDPMEFIALPDAARQL